MPGLRRWRLRALGGLNGLAISRRSRCYCRTCHGLPRNGYCRDRRGRWCRRGRPRRRSGARGSWGYRARRSNSRGSRLLAQAFARGLSRPGAGINITDYAEPLFGLVERVEVAHVQPEALAPILESAADKERKTPQLRRLWLGQGHRRVRRAQIDHERTRRTLGVGCRVGATSTAGGRLCERYCHSIPRKRSIGDFRVRLRGAVVTPPS